MSHRSILAIAALALTWTACPTETTETTPPTDETSTIDTAPTPTEPGTAELRVLHLSPDAGPVDIYVDEIGTPILSDFTFTTGTPFVQLEAGVHTVHVTTAGDPVDDAVLSTALPALAEDTQVSAAVIGTTANLTVLTLDHDPATVPAGQVRHQLTHAADGFAAIDLTLAGQPAASWADDLPFGATAVVEAAPGATVLEVDLDDDGVADVSFGLPDWTGEAVVNVYLLLDEASDPFVLAQLGDSSLQRISPTAR